MKRKDLYNFVSEEIINELTEIDIDKTSGAVVMKKGANPSDIKKLTSQGIDVELKEMARIASRIKLGDPEMVQLALDVYGGSATEKIINLVKDAGEEGTTQEEIASALGIKNPTTINSEINSLVKAKALVKSEKKSAAKAIEPTAAEPEVTASVEKDEWESEDEDVKDEWEKSEEEETTPEGPSASDIAAAEKEAAKVSGGKGYAKALSPEDEEKYAKLRKGIDAKVSKISKMKKSQVVSSDDFKILKQLVSRDDVKKLFKAKGVDLKAILADIM